MIFSTAGELYSFSFSVSYSAKFIVDEIKKCDRKITLASHPFGGNETSIHARIICEPNSVYQVSIQTNKQTQSPVDFAVVVFTSTDDNNLLLDKKHNSDAFLIKSVAYHEFDIILFLMCI